MFSQPVMGVVYCYFRLVSLFSLSFSAVGFFLSLAGCYFSRFPLALVIDVATVFVDVPVFIVRLLFFTYLLLLSGFAATMVTVFRIVAHLITVLVIFLQPFATAAVFGVSPCCWSFCLYCVV